MRALMVVALALMAGTALASEPDPGVMTPGPMEEMGIPGLGEIPYQRLTVAIGEPGETMDDFILRIAPLLDAYTARSEFEACGVIAQAPDGHFGIVIGTNLASLNCANDHGRVPDGMASVWLGLHSHPNTLKVRPTTVDRFIRNGPGKPALQELVRNAGRYGFSYEDFQVPGYLVAGGKILFENGDPKHVRIVGKLEHPAHIRYFDPR